MSPEIFALVFTPPWSKQLQTEKVEYLCCDPAGTVDFYFFFQCISVDSFFMWQASTFLPDGCRQIISTLSEIKSIKMVHLTQS